MSVSCAQVIPDTMKIELNDCALRLCVDGTAVNVPVRVAIVYFDEKGECYHFEAWLSKSCDSATALVLANKARMTLTIDKHNGNKFMRSNTGQQIQITEFIAND